MNEGFFADVAVLVEGEDDRAAILGTAMALVVDFDGNGIAVIPCMGKTNLDRPMLIFRDLGIPVYVVWDGDHNNRNAKPEVNARLLDLNELTIEDWPDGVWQNCACFKTDLETTIKCEFGQEPYDRLFTQAKNELDFHEEDQATKNPAVFRKFVELAAIEEIYSHTLGDIVGAIHALRESSVSA